MPLPLPSTQTLRRAKAGSLASMNAVTIAVERGEIGKAIAARGAHEFVDADRRVRVAVEDQQPLALGDPAGLGGKPRAGEVEIGG